MDAIMSNKNRFSIGDVSKICNISRKALRYYDTIGLINSSRHEANNYRYYDKDALLLVPVIKYYKQMGFTLEEMSQFIDGDIPNVYPALKKSFTSKIGELEQERMSLERKRQSTEDWYQLITEAQLIIDNDVNDISIKYVEPQMYLYLNQHFDNDIKSAIINIEWTNYLEKIGNEITGPVIINFSSFERRMANLAQPVKILQKTLLPHDEENELRLGGCMMASCYHIGCHGSLHETYKKIDRWARTSGYTLAEECFERYVTDYWTTNNSSQFVTEILISITKDAHRS